MNDDRRMTHVWHVIERRAFSPSVIVRSSWLHCFTQTIPAWIPDSIVQPPKVVGLGIQGAFGSKSLDLECRYSIKDERSDFDILIPSHNWQYGIESTEFFWMRDLNGWEDDVGDLRQEDVDKVLRGMIEHPRMHLHVFTVKPQREIRVGTGLDETFLFLFQFRFQLCLDPARRKNEIDRLKGIFTLDWLRRESDISPHILFGL